MRGYLCFKNLWLSCLSFPFSGLPSQAFEYIYYNGGIESEKDYPYTAKDGSCHFNKSEVAATVSGIVNISKVYIHLSLPGGRLGRESPYLSARIE